MAKLSVWLHQGITVPSSGLTTTTLTAGTINHDGWYELSGSESQIKVDYKAITGYVMDSYPKSSATTIGSGSLFGDGLDGEN